jgi:thioester reductase-like protein
MSATILLTGATGYVGERLLGRLEREDLMVRCRSRCREAGRLVCA